MNLLYIIPIITPVLIVITLIIVSISNDKFIKSTEVNQLNAITKILNFIGFFLVFLSIIVLISLELANYNTDEIKEVINNEKLRYSYIYILTFLTIFVSIIYVIIMNNKNKIHYSIENFNNSNHRLLLLQKHKDTFICTLDDSENNDRIIIPEDKIYNLKLVIHKKRFFQDIDFTYIFKRKSNLLKISFFLFLHTVLFISTVGILFLLWLLNDIFNFNSITLIIITLLATILVISFYTGFIIENFKNYKEFKSK
ncbi:hypothetical protein MXL82_04945 [Staphylococcus gallinarum]|uniref:hypothetical protein n=1 Tax=Staphylococcus gallinarum TaxID=1293 RepID=UPI002DBFD789|nr:hypothetical protein [Staphylococcus gallinarum]MEB6242397.1 hypothetical protein [Staphylococcus gallinarum]MEB6295574.1 hypothetical protein [Staphylococcus gallinarum]